MVARFLLAGCVTALSAVVSAQDDPHDPWQYQLPSIFTRVDSPFNFADCAAPKEMETCWQAQNLTTDLTDEICSGLFNRINCTLTNCWNRVYSCDYQQLMVVFNDTGCNDPNPDYPWPVPGMYPELPFYPAPADAAGECSCDLKSIDDTTASVSDAYFTCLDKVHNENGVTDDENEQYTLFGVPAPQCSCCLYGATAAALWDTCPSQDPGFILLDVMKQMYIDTPIIGGNITLADCPAILANQSFSCADYGFTNYGKNASDYAKPTPLHSATGTWSDINGILTSPVSGATYTWEAGDMTITAASVEAVATRTASATEKVTSGTAGSSPGTASGTAADTATGTAPGETTKSTGAAPTDRALQYPAAALVGLGGIAFALL